MIWKNLSYSISVCKCIVCGRRRRRRHLKIEDGAFTIHSICIIFLIEWVFPYCVINSLSHVAVRYLTVMSNNNNHEFDCRLILYYCIHTKFVTLEIYFVCVSTSLWGSCSIKFSSYNRVNHTVQWFPRRFRRKLCASLCILSKNHIWLLISLNVFLPCRSIAYTDEMCAVCVFSLTFCVV